MTIHITPEPEFSYVSFESNIPLASYLDVIQRVLNTFLPGKFILTIFANRVRFFISAYYMTLVLNCDLKILSILHLNFFIFLCRHPWRQIHTRNCKRMLPSEIG